MQYKLLAIDIDGTLHTSSREIPHLIPPFLKELEERGVLVVLCTGRRYRTALPIYRSLALRGPIGLHSGALVIDPATGRRLFVQYLEARTARRACSIMCDSGLQPLIWVDNYPDSPDIITSAECTGFTKEYIGRHKDFVMCVADPFRFDSPRIPEVGAWAGFDELNPVSATIERELGDSARTHIARDIIGDYSILEIMSPRAGKWNAVKHLAQMYGIAQEEIVAVGDNYNDIELVDKAGLGVAMGNAVEPVKAVAAHITSSNDEEGLYRALKRAFR